MTEMYTDNSDSPSAERPEQPKVEIDSTDRQWLAGVEEAFGPGADGADPAGDTAGPEPVEPRPATHSPAPDAAPQPADIRPEKDVWVEALGELLPARSGGEVRGGDDGQWFASVEDAFGPRTAGSGTANTAEPERVGPCPVSLNQLAAEDAPPPAVVGPDTDEWVDALGQAFPQRRPPAEARRTDGIDWLEAVADALGPPCAVSDTTSATPEPTEVRRTEVSANDLEATPHRERPPGEPGGAAPDRDQPASAATLASLLGDMDSSLERVGATLARSDAVFSCVVSSWHPLAPPARRAT